MLSFSSKPVEIFQKGRSYTKEEYDLEVVRRAMVSPHIPLEGFPYRVF